MFNDVYHIAYLTDDVDAATEMYRTLFGAEVLLTDTSATTGSKMTYLRVGNTQIELIQPADIGRLAGRSGLVLDHIGYVVENIDAEMRRLEAQGVGFASPAPKISAEGARLIYLDAVHTLGARIHLTERPLAGAATV